MVGRALPDAHPRPRTAHGPTGQQGGGLLCGHDTSTAWPHPTHLPAPVPPPCPLGTSLRTSQSPRAVGGGWGTPTRASGRVAPPHRPRNPHNADPAHPLVRAPRPPLPAAQRLCPRVLPGPRHARPRRNAACATPRRGPAAPGLRRGGRGCPGARRHRGQGRPHRPRGSGDGPPARRAGAAVHRPAWRRRPALLRRRPHPHWSDRDWVGECRG